MTVHIKAKQLDQSMALDLRPEYFLISENRRSAFAIHSSVNPSISLIQVARKSRHILKAA